MGGGFPGLAHESLALNVGKWWDMFSASSGDLTMTYGSIEAESSSSSAPACSLPTVPVLCWKTGFVVIQCMS